MSEKLLLTPPVTLLLGLLLGLWWGLAHELLVSELGEPPTGQASIQYPLKLPLR